MVDPRILFARDLGELQQRQHRDAVTIYRIDVGPVVGVEHRVWDLALIFGLPGGDPRAQARQRTAERRSRDRSYRTENGAQCRGDRSQRDTEHAGDQAVAQPRIHLIGERDAMKLVDRRELNAELIEHGLVDFELWVELIVGMRGVPGLNLVVDLGVELRQRGDAERHVVEAGALRPRQEGGEPRQSSADRMPRDYGFDTRLVDDRTIGIVIQHAGDRLVEADRKPGLIGKSRRPPGEAGTD